MYMFEKQLTDFCKMDIASQVNILLLSSWYMGDMNFFQQERWNLISTAKGSVVLAITVKIWSHIDASSKYMV